MKAVELTISQKGCWPRSRNFAHCATYQWLDAARLRCNRLGGSQSQSNVSVTMVELPAPTGPFSIGAKIYNWVDRSRRELTSKNPTDSRQLIVQVWYPTEDRSGPAQSIRADVDRRRRTTRINSPDRFRRAARLVPRCCRWGRNVSRSFRRGASR